MILNIKYIKYWIKNNCLHSKTIQKYIFYSLVLEFLNYFIVIILHRFFRWCVEHRGRGSGCQPLLHFSPQMHLISRLWSNPSQVSVLLNVSLLTYECAVCMYIVRAMRAEKIMKKPKNLSQKIGRIKKEIVYLNYQRYFINKMLRSFLAPKRAQGVRLWSVCPSVSLCTLCNKA